MARFTLREILTATGGTAIHKASSRDVDYAVDGVCTDSRMITPGNLFIALTGNDYDGHDFCAGATEGGAKILIVSKLESIPEGVPAILVPDTLAALQSLASYYRKRLNCMVLAITGSVGKTSTREMLSIALSSSFRTYSTKENFNNEIGLPLTILSAPENTELLIVEMGMRLKNEIRLLSNIAQPDIAVITNIGVSHIERLGSREEILSAKMEVCEGLRANGLLVINGDDGMLRTYVSIPQNKNWKHLGVTSFTGCKEAEKVADIYAYSENVCLSESGATFTGCIREKGKTETKTDCELSTVGAHLVKNALLTLLCASYLQADLRAVCQKLVRFVPIGSRGRIIKTPSYTIYDDAYNASPESMSAAFDCIKLIGGHKRKIAAIGGILELGKYSAEIHRQVGVHAAQAGLHILYICGDSREAVKSGAESINPDIETKLFEDTENLINELLHDIRPGDLIMIKASHAFEFENISGKISLLDSENNYRKEVGGDTLG
jgi:UDP-N-acetylmuramoyl-tripeptide--D-alanyl-D-alanine ligase